MENNTECFVKSCGDRDYYKAKGLVRMLKMIMHFTYTPMKIEEVEKC